MKPRLKGTPPLKGQSGFDYGYTDPGTWKPISEFPQIRGRAKRVIIDFESNGNELRKDTIPVGVALKVPELGFKAYFPTRHPGGGNLDENSVIRFLKGEIWDVDIQFCEAKFDLGLAEKWGISFENQNCRPREIQFQAALLDDKRTSYSLESLAQWRLKRGKVPIGTKKVWELPVSVAGPYAETDVDLTGDCHDSMAPEIEKQGLQKVYDLECDIIWAVMEMERNGSLLDMDLLEQWDAEIRKKLQKIVLDIYSMTQLRINPNSPKDMEKLFRNLGIEFGYTDTDQGTFTHKFLKDVEHPAVKLATLYRSLYSLWSKFIRKMLERGNEYGGKFHYKLNQLKLDRSGEAGIYGAVSGRFSSSKDNIQQIREPKKQIKKSGNTDYIIRKGFIPPKGRLWMKADGDQIEFRGFAHYSKNPALIKAYEDDPKVDFHVIVMKLIQVLREIDREDTKMVNFGKLYGMGRDKNARQLGLSREEADQVFEAYDRAFPDAGRLMREAMNLARKRGWVKTYLGRLARFNKNDSSERYHSALNRVIQGTCADIMKMKILEIYRERKVLDIVMRSTVHDELNCDSSDDPVKHALFHEAMHVQSFPLRVPITWDIKYGPNWAMMSEAA